jgi:hypothetical protein
MGNKHKKTLLRIFEIPTRNDISYPEVKNLFQYLGGNIKNGNGSRRQMSIKTKNVKKPLVCRFHEPHGSDSFGEYQIELFQEFLTKIGITPDNDTIF